MLKSETMTGLISAVPFEADLIVKSLKPTASPVLEGTIAGSRVAYICSGVGIANAARAVAILAERERPDAIILFGIGGAYARSGPQKGGLAAASAEVYAEGGLLIPAAKEKTVDGFRALGFPLLKKGGKNFFGSFPLDRGLLRQAKKCIADLRTGRFLTVWTAQRSVRKADLLGIKYGAVMENMEGAAAAQTALFYGIPLLEIRGVSNIAGEPPRKWIKEEAAVNCQAAVLKFLETWF